MRKSCWSDCTIFQFQYNFIRFLSFLIMTPSLLAKLENFSGLRMGWQTGRGCSELPWDGMPHYGCGRPQSQGSPSTTGAKSPSAGIRPKQTASLKHINFHPRTLQAPQQSACLPALECLTSEHWSSPRRVRWFPSQSVFEGSAGS